MNRDNIKHYVSKTRHRLYLVPLHILNAIPLSEIAQQNILGFTDNMHGCPYVAGKHKFIEAIDYFNENNPGCIKFDKEFDGICNSIMLDLIFGFTKCMIDFSAGMKHPYTLAGTNKVMPFAQLVAYKKVLARQDYKEFDGPSYDGDTLMLRAHYHSGGSIVLGIEPDGYTHT